MEMFPYASMRDSFDLRSYVVLGPDDTKGRDVADVVRYALHGGASFIQLRAKHADVRDIVAMAADIAAVIEDEGKADTVAFVIDDRVDAALEARHKGIKVDGVHIGQDDNDPQEARRLLGRDAIVGLSAKTPDDMRRAEALPQGTVDYLGAGPWHETSTKPDCIVVGDDGVKHTLDAATLHALHALTTLPIVVGGGVKAADIPDLAASDADGWFVVSAVTAADDPEAATRELVDAWQAVRGDTMHDHPAAALLPTTLPAALSIASTDSSGGAGVPVDIKTMMANGVFAECVICAITAQNTKGVTHLEELSPQAIVKQIDAVYDDIAPAAVKIGMVPSIEGINAVADGLQANKATNIVVDPVMVATSGAKLINDDAIATLTSCLFPMATLITPNLPETRVLLETIGSSIDPQDEDSMEQAGLAIAQHFGCSVLVKGGHGLADANDVLVNADGTTQWFRGERINNPNTHGTGCTLSSAIAANLAKGQTLVDAIANAKRYITGALRQMLELGTGSGPFDHAWMWR